MKRVRIYVMPISNPPAPGIGGAQLSDGSAGIVAISR
jgi:hypothetical protein